MPIYKKSFTLVPIDPRTGAFLGLRGAYTACKGMRKGAELPPMGNTGIGEKETREGTNVLRPTTLHSGEFTDTPSGNARLAIGVGYLLAGRAVLNFPTTNRAAPSRYVQVSLSQREPLRDQDRGCFPMLVAWDIWENAIVPVLQADENQITQPYLRELFGVGQYLRFFQYVHGKLILSFREQGLIP